MSDITINPVRRIIDLAKKEKKNIRFLYGYAIVAGAISLVLPLGIQAILGLVLAGNLSSSWIILVVVITLGVLIAGLTKLAQISILENIQQKLFVNVAFEFSDKITRMLIQKKKHSNLVEMSEKFLDVITVQKSFSKLLLDFSASALQIIFGLMLLVFYHPSFLIFGFIVVISVSVILKLTWTRGISTARKESDYKFKTAYWILEIAQNRSIFHLKSEKPYHLKKADEYLTGYLTERKEHFKVLYSQALIAVIMKVFLTGGLVVMGSYLLVHELLSIGQFLASEILIFSMLGAVEKLILSVENIYDSGIALEKLGYVTDAEVESEKTALEFTEIGQSTATQIIEKETNRLLLDVKKGEKIGIIGIPGTGRTRVIKTILGESQDDWKALLNGVPLDNINLKSLGKNTGVCLQSNDVFEGSFASNIALSNEFDTNEIVRLVELLNLQKFISTLPEGFLHKIDAYRGLPGNIVNKILLGRALYGSPGLLLLDDIWDLFNRAEIESIMHYLKSISSTVILISNHVPVLQHMDRVFFIEDSNFTEYGKVNSENLDSKLKPLLWL